MAPARRTAPPRLPSRRGRPRTAKIDAEDRALVLRVAGELLEAEGASALSVRRIAGLLGASYQLVYTLFGGKPGLLEALFRSGFETLVAECRRVPRSGSPVADFAELALAYRRFALSHPRLYALMFGGGVADFEPGRAARRHAFESFQVVREGAARVLEASPTARARFETADALARAAFSATHGHVVIELDSWFGRDADAPARLAETVRALAGGGAGERKAG